MTDALTDLHNTVQRLQDELTTTHKQLTAAETLTTAAIKWFHNPGNPTSDPVFAAAVWAFLKDEYRRERRDRQTNEAGDQTP